MKKTINIFKYIFFRPHNIVIAKLKGGLGNQLFIYCTARNLAFKNKAILFIDHTTGFVKDKKYQRESQLQKYVLYDQKDVIFLPKILSIIIYLLIRINLNLKFLNIEYIKQIDRKIENKLLVNNYKTSLYIDGLWQSYKYFQESKEILANEIYPRFTTKKLMSLKNKILNSEFNCAIHIRIFNKKNTKNLKNISNFINNALKKFQDIEKFKFYIFSESKEISFIIYNSNIKNINYELISKKHEQGAVGDLFLMSCCKNHIITNSTFGWWGAWLSKNKSKKIICPSKLNGDIYGEGVWGFKDFIPKQWIQIAFTEKVTKNEK